jgi:hypothetical protein
MKKERVNSYVWPLTQELAASATFGVPVRMPLISMTPARAEEKV